MGQSYELIIGGIIPATQEAYTQTGVDMAMRRAEKASVTAFKAALGDAVAKERPPADFPTTSPVFVAIIQFFTSKKRDYNTRDVDNMAKTVLDVLQENGLYAEDHQVRTLLVSKRVDLKKMPQNIGYIYVRILDDGEDITLVDGTVKKALQLYEKLKKREVAEIA